MAPPAEPGPAGLRRARRNLALVGVAAVVVFLVTYLLLVRTRFGQTFGDEAYVGRLVADEATQRASADLLDLVDRATLVVLGLVVLLVGAVRRHFLVSFVAAATFAAAVVSAEVLKRVLPRPDLVPDRPDQHWDAFNTFPSGHATIATGFVVSVLLVAPARWRPWAAIAGSLWASLMTSGTLAAGWHRPADAIGGVCLATAWCVLGALWVLPRRFQDVPAPPGARYLLPGGLTVLAVVSLLVAASLVLGDNREQGSPGAFLISSIVIDVVTVAVVCLLAWLLRGVSPRSPGGRG